MGFLEAFIYLLGDNAALIAFLGSLIIGEEVLVFLSILAGRGLAPLWVIFVYGFVGSLLGDLFWFWVGRSRVIDWIKKIRFIRRSYGHARPLLEKIGVHNIRGWRCGLYFGLTKFLGVVKVIAIVYIARRGMPLSRFLKWNIPALIIWLIPMLFAGWLAGKGFTLLLRIIENLQTALGIAIVLAIIIYIAIRWGAQIILKRSLKKNKK